jgi:hypothetical protein
MLAERWYRSIDGIPFDDGQARAGQADESAEHDQERHDRSEDIQPFHNGFVLSDWHCFSEIEVESDCSTRELIRS